MEMNLIWDFDWMALGEPLLRVGILLSAAFLIHLMTKKYVFRFLRHLANRALSKEDTDLLGREPFARLALVVPFTVIQIGSQFLGESVSPQIQSLIQRVALAITFILLARVFSAVLDNVHNIYLRSAASIRRPIKGYLQVLIISVYFLAVILALSALVDRSPLLFLSGLGAMTAVLMLVFRDTILSLVAGVQLTTNDLLRVGDWIEMPQFNADGDVIDIALNVVKVQNFDKTIVVIPAHKFIEHSFKNWRGMEEAGGRRIKRSIPIDLQSISFLSDEDIKKFSKFHLLNTYIESKGKELEEYNSQVPQNLSVSSRRLTNLGTFRAYVSNYLKSHPLIRKDLTFLVRQLEPGPDGLPLQIYVFSNDTAWANYESVQADVFDHLLAIVPEFGLRVFQRPSGLDFRGALSQVGRMDD